MQALYFRPVSCFFLFFHRLVSAFAEWMSTILLHMVWPVKLLDIRGECKREVRINTENKLATPAEVILNIHYYINKSNIAEYSSRLTRNP